MVRGFLGCDRVTFPRGLASFLGRPGLASGRDRVAFGFSSPKPSRVSFGRVNPFSGWVFWLGSERTAREVHILVDGKESATASVNLPRPDLALAAPQFPAAAHGGFAADVFVPIGGRHLSVVVRWDTGAPEVLATADLADWSSQRDELAAQASRVDALPVPEPDLLELTQGNRDIEGYRESSLTSAHLLDTYLLRSGFEVHGARSVLDFGCGSGRLLVGLWARYPSLRLSGCDINGRLIGWARTHLPADIAFEHNAPEPPLPYPDRSFDFVYLISVFTHLPLGSQRLWAEEIRRVMKPGGALLLTLHGETYVRFVFRGDESRLRSFRREGHLELPLGTEGSKSYASFHAPAVARDLLRGFRPVGFFPNGRIGRQRSLFALAVAQDVYLFRRD